MDRMEILNTVCELFSELLEREVVLEESQELIEIKEFDSLMLMTFMVILESTFNCEFSINEMANIKTVGQIVDVIESKIER